MLILYAIAWTLLTLIGIHVSYFNGYEKGLKDAFKDAEEHTVKLIESRDKEWELYVDAIRKGESK